ncbi:hypothetical protein [Aeromonas veronii]|uniref:hypothetical protein n=1 Tax=Aeromonas veronii TaxID=654 RepID=UPI00226C8FDA|nr:hypothetical protein [Aeromonas veronii]MCX9104037.1 hypothetical protein [Aeromonas veronii]MCX9119688.1 hypothetical protein [Aeromonas veronii]
MPDEWSEEAVAEAWNGLNESYEEMERQIAAKAPRCHFLPMGLEHGDGEDYHSQWWECSVCGHTKPAY